MIGRIEETSASFEARSAPRSYPTFISRSFIGHKTLANGGLASLRNFACEVHLSQDLVHAESSAVVGSITERTRAIEFAGNPPFWACARTVSSSGATYMQ